MYFCVFKRSTSTKISQPAAGRTSGSLKTPDDSSRIPQQPITTSLPRSSLPINRLSTEQMGGPVRVLEKERVEKKRTKQTREI